MKNEMVDSIKRSSKPHETAGSLDLPFISFALNSGIYKQQIIPPSSSILFYILSFNVLPSFMLKIYRCFGFIF